MSQRSATYEKLDLLNDEISQGIRNLSTEPRSSIDAEISELKETAYRTRAPEAEFALSQFRKYADIANSIDESRRLNRREDLVSNQSMFEVPSYVFEGSPEQLVGISSLKKNIFWFRGATAIFCFIAYVLYASTPFISETQLHPQTILEENCQYIFANVSFTGYFHMGPYIAALVIASISYLYSIAFCVYYLLPVDEQNRKFVPGLVKLFSFCVAEEDFMASSNGVAVFCLASSKLIEMVADAVIFVVALIITVTASSNLDSSTRIITEDWSSGPETYSVDFYTLETFFATYSYSSPPCVDSSPSDTIRAALAMQYIALIWMALAVQVSFRSYLSSRSIRQHAGPHASPSALWTISAPRGDVEEAAVYSALPPASHSSHAYSSSHSSPVGSPVRAAASPASLPGPRSMAALGLDSVSNDDEGHGDEITL